MLNKLMKLCQFGIPDAWNGLGLLVILIIELMKILWLPPVPRLFNYCPGKVADNKMSQ